MVDSSSKVGLYTSEQLKNSPSFQDGVSEEKVNAMPCIKNPQCLSREPQERSTRIFCCVFISDLAQAITDSCGLKQGPVTYAAINTAKHFFQRFYMNQSLAKQKNFKVIVTGLICIGYFCDGCNWSGHRCPNENFTAYQRNVSLRCLQDRGVPQIPQRIHLGME